MWLAEETFRRLMSAKFSLWTSWRAYRLVECLKFSRRLGCNGRFRRVQSTVSGESNLRNLCVAPMTTGYPCPNPACSHVFPPAEVKGAAALSCPRCGAVFRFRAGGPTGAKRAAETVPIAIQVAPPMRPSNGPAAEVPLATPVAVDRSSGIDFSLSRPRPLSRGRHTGRSRRGVWLTLLAVLVLGGAIGVGWWQFHSGAPILPVLSGTGGQTPTGSVHESSQFNYRFSLPPAPWQQVQDTRVAVKANLLAMRRTNPDAWMALAAQDYKDRTPRDAEVIDEIIRRLRGHFQESLEYEPAGDAELAGRPALRIIFQGTVHDVLMSGECYLFRNRGLAYWFMTWAPSDHVQEHQKEFAELRRGFALLADRDDWVEKKPKLITYRGTQAPYSLQGREDLWQKREPAVEYDPAADLALHANDRVASRDMDKTAQALVLLLKPQEGQAPQTVARSYFDEQQKALYPKTRSEAATDRVNLEGQPAKIGSVAGHISRLHVFNSDTRQRYVVLAVAPDKEHIIVIQCECDWKRRSLWERDFEELIATFRWEAKK